MIVTIHVDGSIVGGNPGGAGGWAAVHVSGEGESQRHRITSGSEYDTSNNRMEMLAAIEGIRAHPIRRQIRLVSDSEYLILGFTKRRVEKWASDNYRKKGKSIPNADLWRDLNDLDLARDIEWVHQRGEHRRASTLGGAERYAALAHEFAISEARVAHWAREKRMEGLTTPESLEERTALIELLKELPVPPDPPPRSSATAFAVYQRIGSPRNLMFRGPIYIPVAPSKLTDRDGMKDGGRWECHKAARTMSETDSTKEGMRYKDWRMSRYVVMRYGLEPSERNKQSGACYYRLSEEQFERLQKEAGKDDGILRAVPGGRAGGAIAGSIRAS